MADLEQIDSTIEVVTPENISFEYRVAGPFRRLTAFVVDWILKMAITILLYFLLSLAFMALSFFGGASLSLPLLGMLAVGQFVMDWFYGGLFECYMNGQTPGKRLLGIRVVTTDGRPINGLQAIMRNVMRAVDMMPLLSAQMVGAPAMYLVPVFTVGLVVTAMNRRFQRLGDLVCGTMVVVEERQWLTGVARLEDPRAYQLASYLPADFEVKRDMARALANYVERRRFFSVPRRREIAAHLAVPLLRRFGLPMDTSYDLLLCSLYYRSFVADRGADEKHAAEAAAAMAANRGIQFTTPTGGPHPADPWNSPSPGPPPGAAPQPYPPPSTSQQGYPQQGYPQQGYPQQGYPASGYPPQQRAP